MENSTKSGTKYYFIGIGGISMSSLAIFVKSFGNEVVGSDCTPSHITKQLEQHGIKVNLNHNADNIVDDIDYVVYSGAIKQNNSERVRAFELGIPQIERSKFLGKLATMYNNVISVAGTHGKTTTTSMLAEIMLDAGLNPTIHLGGESVRFGNTYLGGKHYFVTEACEYRNSFASLKSNIGVITNIECDHMDYYKNLRELNNAFENFANNCERVVLWQNRTLAKRLSNSVVIGFNKFDDFFVCDVKRDEIGRYSYLIKHQGKDVARVNLTVGGVHNVKNSACAFVVAYLLGASPDVITKSLSAFKGVVRRYEHIGVINGKPVVADYAHHPTEIKASIKTSINSYGKVLCVFQPHTYTRTLTLMSDFVTCFSGVEHLIVYKTYEARESFVAGGDAKDLFNNVAVKSKYYFDDITNLLQKLENLENYDMVLVLGAGDIYDVIKNAISSEKMLTTD